MKTDTEPSVHRNGAVWLTLHIIIENRAEGRILLYLSVYLPKIAIFFTGLPKEAHCGNGRKCSEILFPKELC